MDLLETLNIQQINSGACSGSNWQNVSDSVFESINPSTEKCVASVSNATQNDYETILSACIDAQQNWKLQPVQHRSDFIKRIIKEIKHQRENLVLLISMEIGFEKQDALTEIQCVINFAENAIRQSLQITSTSIQTGHPKHRITEQWFPVGVVAIISPFNKPMSDWARNALTAIACGNTVIWKPSSQAPLCAIAIQSICNKVMNDLDCEDLTSLFITDNISDVELLVADKRINLISFTGSSKVGKRVNSIAANRMGQCLLSTSSNSAVIIDETADLNLAISNIPDNAMQSNGQQPTTPRRLFIHYSIYSEAIKKLISTYSQNTTSGPLINIKSVDNYIETISNIEKSNGEILCGGKIIDKQGFFVEPCIVAISHDTQITIPESISPILYVMQYQGISDAIEMVNEISHDFSSALFTNNLKSAELFLSVVGSKSRNANINLCSSDISENEIDLDNWKNYVRIKRSITNWG